MNRRAPRGALITLLSAVLVLLAACGSETARVEPDIDQTVRVRVVPVERSRFVEYGDYFGEVTAATEIRLTVPRGGRVEQILANPGDQVRAGASLARIDAEQAITAHDTAFLAERIARRSYETERALHESGDSSMSAMDQAHLSWLQKRTALLEARKARDGALAVTPIDGTVVARHVDRFDELRPGTATFTVADLRTMRVRVGIPESDIAGVSTIESAEVQVSSIPGRVWTGRPESFARKRSEESMTFEVDIAIDNSDEALYSGVTARVRIGLRAVDNALVVPMPAVITEGARSFVMTERDGTVHKTQVELGPMNAQDTVVRSGLAEGDRVVVTGLNQVRDGATVHVLEG